MNKVKRILAVVLAMAMVMAMSIVSSAATNNSETHTYTSTITITGFAAGTEVKAYCAVSLDTSNPADYKWTVAEWATDYVTPGTATVSDPKGLGAAASGQTVVQTKIAEATSVVFEDLPVGAYVFIGSSTTHVYSPVVANTYDTEQTYMAAKDVTATAKGTTEIITTKKADDTFVAKGETVTFTVTTIFPNFVEMNPTEGANSYKIKDTATGLDIKRVKNIVIGTTPVTPNASSYVGNDYIIDLSNQIGDTVATFNQYAGAQVTIEYEAEVTSDEGYSNTVNALRNDVKLGEPGETEGFTGSIELTKYATETENGLEGATFIVYKTISNADAAPTIKYATFNANNAFNGWEDSKDLATGVATNADGIVKVTGLDEGTYTLEETVAPKGYSLNQGEDGKKIVTISDENATANINLTKDTPGVDLIMYNTKLSALPSTGGIGITIFTIVGCLIMIAAATMFFISRRKSEE